MKPERLFIVVMAAVALLHAAAAVGAEPIDMDDPRRVVGREDNVRVDARLMQDTISPGAPVGVVYQVQNLTSAPIAIAADVADASFDKESSTITLAIGAEVPPQGRMPRMQVIAPGETKVLNAGAAPALSAAAGNPRFGGVPRYVQVKVSFLRDVEPFANVIARQSDRGGVAFPEELFDRWFESQDTIFLNAVPVRFSPRGRGVDASAGARSDAARRF